MLSYSLSLTRRISKSISSGKAEDAEKSESSANNLGTAERRKKMTRETVNGKQKRISHFRQTHEEKNVARP